MTQQFPTTKEKGETLAMFIFVVVVVVVVVVIVVVVVVIVVVVVAVVVVVVVVPLVNGVLIVPLRNRSSIFFVGFQTRKKASNF